MRKEKETFLEMTTDFPRNENLNDFSINRNFAPKISERNDQENFSSDTFYSSPFGYGCAHFDRG